MAQPTEVTILIHVRLMIRGINPLQETQRHELIITEQVPIRLFLNDKAKAVIIVQEVALVQALLHAQVLLHHLTVKVVLQAVAVAHHHDLLHRATTAQGRVEEVVTKPWAKKVLD